MKKLAVLFLFMLSALLAFSACEEVPEGTTHVVRFDVSRLSYVTSVPESLEVADGETVTAPNITDGAPTGYETIWTADPKTAAPYDFSAAVREDLTLTAIETPKHYEIEYLIEPGMGQNSAYNPTSYTMLDEITLRAPIKSTIPFGYRFVKWCSVKDLDGEVAEIERGTQGKLILVAVFRPYEYTVEYADLNGAANPNPTRYRFGDEVTLQPLEAEGFLGFTAYKSHTLEVTELTGDFVAAHWQELFNSNYIYIKANWEETE